MVYTGRDMKTVHKGMVIDEHDWKALLGHLNGTLNHLGLTGEDREAVVGFVESTKGDIVEGMAGGRNVLKIGMAGSGRGSTTCSRTGSLASGRGLSRGSAETYFSALRENQLENLLQLFFKHVNARCEFRARRDTVLPPFDEILISQTSRAKTTKIKTQSSAG
jgi:hypothetical protein